MLQLLGMPTDTMCLCFFRIVIVFVSLFCSMYELHVIDLSPSPDHLCRPSSSTLKFDLTASLDFRSSSSMQLELVEDASAKRGLSASIDTVFSFEERIANSLQARFAFMLHNVNNAAADLGGAGAAMGEKDAVRPLDIAYLARLAMYENFHSSEGNSLHAQRVGAIGSSMHTPLAHTRASDEEMWLLIAGVHIVPATAPTTSSTATVTSSASPTSTATQSPSSASSKTAEEAQRPAQSR